MKLKLVISCFLLVVYSFILTEMQCVRGQCCHEHHWCEHQNYQHETHHHNPNLPYHDESQHSEEYVFDVKNIHSQINFYPVICCLIQVCELTLPVCESMPQSFCYVPQKIPKQYSQAFPLRAPPVV